MPANGKRSSHFPLMSAIVMFLALASICFGFSMTIPLEKGNIWKYSYDIHTVTNETADTSVGQLSMYIDSIATLSDQIDSMFFRLAIIDSGTTKDTLSSHYQLSYTKHFYAYHDTVFSVDTITSPGFCKVLMYYYRMPDTSIITIGPDVGSYSRRTDSITIMAGTQLYEAFSMVTGQSLRHVSPGSSYGTSTNMTFQWINRIGTAYYSENQESESWGTTITTTSRTYTLESFNGAPIPPIPISAIQTGRSALKTASPMIALNKIVYIKNSVPKTVFSPKTIYFNLQGQKLARLLGGQLLLQELRF